jgi:hypothetical protein
MLSRYDSYRSDSRSAAAGSPRASRVVISSRRASSGWIPSPRHVRSHPALGHRARTFGPMTGSATPSPGPSLKTCSKSWMTATAALRPWSPLTCLSLTGTLASRTRHRRCHPRSPGSQRLSARAERGITTEARFPPAHADHLRVQSRCDSRFAPISARHHWNTWPVWPKYVILGGMLLRILPHEQTAHPADATRNDDPCHKVYHLLPQRYTTALLCRSGAGILSQHRSSRLHSHADPLWSGVDCLP